VTWRVDDLVSAQFFGFAVVYKIKCFVDRDPCPECVDIEPSEGCPDDAHCELVWQEEESKDWDLAEIARLGVKTLYPPQINEMLLLALAAQ
jgi:hypothetical protein